MPKILTVSPEKVRARGTIRVPDIPVNAYQGTFAEAQHRYGNAELLAILHDMIAIREFEGMLNSTNVMDARAAVM